MDGSILEYYLRRFEDKGRVHSLKGRRQVGMEAKFCLTDYRGEAVEREALEDLFGHLEAAGWELQRDENLGIATAAARPSSTCPAVVATGTGHCKMEFSVPYGNTLLELKSHFEEMAEEVKAYMDGAGVRLLCLGVHPVTEPHPGLVQRTARHIFWDRAFETGLVHLFALSADCQVHVDVDPSEVHQAVNVMQGFAGAQIALTANATVWKRRIDEDFVDVKEAFWDWWLPGEDRAGVASRPFESLEEYVERLSGLRPVFVSRNGCNLGIYQYRNFREYYSAGDEARGITSGGDTVGLRPCEQDIDLHDTFNWFVARFSRYCTLENRVNCQQPPEDIMAVPALTLGLMENLDEGASFLGDYDWDALRRSRIEAMRRGPEASGRGFDIAELGRSMLEIAEKGLTSRGRGEEAFLEALWRRSRGGFCPAFEGRELFVQGGVEALLERYSL
ncbi:MAG: glutamate-cysteine ligase family protein [Actinomycetota bacterium]|nr:glutamate-cysteine ligase family protein [Actinomycetota bacterium]